MILLNRSASPLLRITKADIYKTLMNYAVGLIGLILPSSAGYIQEYSFMLSGKLQIVAGFLFAPTQSLIPSDLTTEALAKSDPIFTFCTSMVNLHTTPDKCSLCANPPGEEGRSTPLPRSPSTLPQWSTGKQ